jgi:hypothetical protein
MGYPCGHVAVAAYSISAFTLVRVLMEQVRPPQQQDEDASRDSSIHHAPTPRGNEAPGDRYGAIVLWSGTVHVNGTTLRGAARCHAARPPCA